MVATSEICCHKARAVQQRGILVISLEKVGEIELVWDIAGKRAAVIQERRVIHFSLSVFKTVRRIRCL